MWTDIKTKCPYNGPAFYFIRAKVDGAIVPVQRWGGADVNGIVCFGHTKAMGTRRKQFLGGWQKWFGHPAGNLLHVLTRFGKPGALENSPLNTLS
jgi:hypothetical protein